MRGFQIHFTNDWSFWVILGSTLLLTLVCLVWTRRALGVVGVKWAWVFFVLRWLALVLLIAFLVNPVLSYRTVQIRRGGVALLVDTSRSMSVKDSLGGASRFEAARAFLTGSDKDFLKRLQDVAEPYVYTFDAAAEMTPVERLRMIDAADGVASNLASALGAIGRQRSSQNLLGVVLLSDGQDNGSEDAQAAARQLDLPVYAVGVGKRDAGGARQDRRLTAVRSNPIAVRHAEALARVTLEHDGFAGDLVDVRILDQETVVAGERVVLSDAGVQEVKLSFQPAARGQRTYRVTIPPHPRDAIAENDSLEFSLLVSDAKIKLLYVEGTLRWEYKFFKRFLQQDPAVEPGFVIRTGDNEITIQGVEGVKLDGGLPSPLDALAKFDVVIIGDVDRNFLSKGAQGRLDRYVGERGGGVLFLAGFHTMLSGEYEGEAVEKLLPVALKSSKVPPPSRSVTLRPSALGRGHDILVGLDRLLDGRKVGNAYSVGQAKPGATVLLEQQADGRGGSEPLLAVQKYGAGRTMMLAADRLWQWDFAAAGAGSSGGRSGAARLWGQMIRWLARQEIEGEAGGPLITAYTDQTYYQPGEAVTINVRPNTRAVGESKLDVDVSVYNDKRRIANVPLRELGDGTILRGSTRPPGDGAYRVEITARAAGRETSIELKFNVGKPFKEMEQLALNESLLRGLAQQTKGGYYTLLNAEDVLGRIRAEAVEVEKRKEVPIVESSVCFLLFLVFVYLEWTFRRRKQLI